MLPRRWKVRGRGRVAYWGMQGKDAVERTRGRGRATVAAALALLLLLLGAPAAASAQGTHRAEIVVHPGEGLRTVHPGLFGVNHRYPYDGFGMLDPSTDSVYPRFAHRFAAAGFTAMRFPGGSVANTYHWKRAIGPPSQRRLNIHGHTGEPLTNGFGPDEFGAFVSSEGVQAMMMANFATGTAQEAADWVEYMNAPVGTNPNGGVAWANVRAANGHPAPYGVQNWEIGNELYQRGQSFWMGGGSLAKRSTRYIFGGSTSFKDQRVGKPWDHQPSAALSDGSANQQFQVWYPPVRPDRPFSITVDDHRWQRVDDLSSAAAGDRVYELDPATGKVTFGDGVHGRIPKEGKVVRASYRSGPHDGFIDYYREMKAADPTIQVGSCFFNGHFLSIMGTKHPYDFVVKHIYSHRPPGGHHGVKQFHDGIMSIAGKRANEVISLRHAIDRQAGRNASSIPIVVSEYGMSFGHRKGPTQNYLGSMDQAVYTALELQRWMQLGIPLAGKQALMYLNGKGAPHGARSLGPPEQALIGPRPKFIMTATARAFRLLTPNAGNEVVRTGVRGSPSRHIYTGKNLKMLSAVATRTSNGGIYVTIVNKARTWRIPARVTVRGKRISSAVVKELVGPSYLSYNSYHHPGRVSIRTHKQWVKSSAMELQVPPHSVVTLRLRR
jgi:alpha-N-arabinofuranosidase